MISIEDSNKNKTVTSKTTVRWWGYFLLVPLGIKSKAWLWNMISQASNIGFAILTISALIWFTKTDTKIPHSTLLYSFFYIYYEFPRNFLRTNNDVISYDAKQNIKTNRFNGSAHRVTVQPGPLYKTCVNDDEDTWRRIRQDRRRGRKQSIKLIQIQHQQKPNRDTS